MELVELAMVFHTLRDLDRVHRHRVGDDVLSWGGKDRGTVLLLEVELGVDLALTVVQLVNTLLLPMNKLVLQELEPLSFGREVETNCLELCPLGTW